MILVNHPFLHTGIRKKEIFHSEWGDYLVQHDSATGMRSFERDEGFFLCGTYTYR